MYLAPTAAPSPDATPVAIGRRAALPWGIWGVVLTVLALICVSEAVRVVIDPNRFVNPLKSLLGALVFMLLFGFIGGLCLRAAWKRRQIAIITDFAGLWLTDGLARTVIPWNDVAAIGLDEYVQTSRGFSHSSWSIELHLHEPLDRDAHPLLDRMVLPADPPRYMIHLPQGTYIDAMAAVKARVPELWIEAPESD